jgi:hypothetical protein
LLLFAHMNTEDLLQFPSFIAMKYNENW